MYNKNGPARRKSNFLLKSNYQNDTANKLIVSSTYVEIPNKRVATLPILFDDDQMNEIEKQLDKNETLLEQLKKFNQIKKKQSQQRQQQTGNKSMLIVNKKNHISVCKREGQQARNKIKRMIQNAKIHHHHQIQNQQNHECWRIRKLSYHGRSVFDKIDGIKAVSKMQGVKYGKN